MTRKTVVIGSNKVMTSVKGENIIQPQEDWTFQPKVQHLSFMNYDDCMIRINDGQELFLKALQGINLNEKGQYVDSFVIETDGIEYQFIGVC